MHFLNFIKLAIAASALSSSVSAQSNTNTILQNVQALSAATGKQYTLGTLGQLASGYQDIVSTLGGGGPLTLFAPTDAAFQGLNASQPELFAKVSGDKELLKKVLLYHVIPTAAFDPAGAPAKSFPTTAYTANAIQVDVANSAVKLTFDQGTANVVDSVPSSNGIIHVVDHVLLPPRPVVEVARANNLTALVNAVQTAGVTETVQNLSNFTLFAPTNAAFDAVTKFAKENNLDLTPSLLASILKFHVVPGQYFSTDVTKAPSTQVATALENSRLDIKVNGNTVTVTGPGNVALGLAPAKVIVADVLVQGGVVHVVDGVLLPELNNKESKAGQTPGQTGNVSAAGIVGVSRAMLLVLVAAVMMVLV